MKTKNKKVVSYNKWGYIFLIPFTVAFVIFQLVPLISTVYYSFFEYYEDGLDVIGPNWAGLKNYGTLFTTVGPGKMNFLIGLKNTMIMWVLGFVPQIILSLLFAAWFSDPSLRLKGQRFFKTVIYLPNLIMASAFSMLFFTLFSTVGPINDIMKNIQLLFGTIKTAEEYVPYDFLAHTGSVRGLVAMMNCLMWFGNTTILLLAGMMGIDQSLFEAAEVDGATARQIFWRITMPILKPILIYVVITSLIGGLQMFDVPEILTNSKGGPNNTSTTLIMYLNDHLYSKNYGMGGALSVILFFITAILSFIVFKFSGNSDKYGKK
ncbi:MAG: sugar ABC transporter permease [Lachnospiraceae bacterium]|nr:sugar ABC transporter permease [Lachnospiraceae bacterium]